MGFTVLIPARLNASRLPSKPLADLAGKPMIVRVAERAQRSAATQVLVAADSPEIIQACATHGVRALLTRSDHPSGSDRLAEACQLLGLDGEDIIVNVQGDEPLIVPALIDAVAALLMTPPHACDVSSVTMSTAAHAITSVAEFTDPNVVKVVTDAHGLALNFSRAPLPWWRDGFAKGIQALPPNLAPLRHIGIYGYRADFLKRFQTLPPAPLEHCEALEQLRALWHGYRIAVHIAASVPAGGVDTTQDLERVREYFKNFPNKL